MAVLFVVAMAVIILFSCWKPQASIPDNDDPAWILLAYFAIFVNYSIELGAILFLLWWFITLS